MSYIFYDAQKDDFYMDTQQVGRRYGFGSGFNYHSEQGWELVNVVAVYFDGMRSGGVPVSTGPMILAVTNYRAFFKRPKP